MSSAIAERWRIVQDEGRAALIPYFTAGYPTANASCDALRMLADSGADFIEVGIPFSDPLADGPVIQESTARALASGMTVSRALDLIERAALDVPVIAFGYLNPILAYGAARFLDHAVAAGVSGVLVTDLPAGEDPGFEGLVRNSRLDLIRLVAPTTPSERLHATVRDAEGFIYLISRLGVTGPQTVVDRRVAETIAHVREATPLPIALGFGIATAAQAAEAARVADGVVVGSALIRAFAEGPAAAQRLMRELRQAVETVDRSPARAGAG